MVVVRSVLVVIGFVVLVVILAVVVVGLCDVVVAGAMGVVVGAIVVVVGAGGRTGVLSTTLTVAFVTVIGAVSSSLLNSDAIFVASVVGGVLVLSFSASAAGMVMSRE